MKVTTDVTTWAAEREALESVLGPMNDAAAEAIRRGGARRRHAARVAHCVDLALEHVPLTHRAVEKALSITREHYDTVGTPEDFAFRLDIGLCPGDYSPEEFEQRLQELRDAVLVGADEIALILNHPGPQRPLWGASLGKGRAAALDADAWEAALLEAHGIIATVVVRLMANDAPSPDFGPLEACLRMAFRHTDVVEQIARHKLATHDLYAANVHHRGCTGGFNADGWREWARLADWAWISS